MAICAVTHEKTLVTEKFVDTSGIQSYVKDGELKSIQKNLVYSKKYNLVMNYYSNGEVAAYFNVEYLNLATKATQIYQYHIVLG
ncbi:hypothetical protein [Enterococcus sp. RIT-PI-f]|uniref:hypothetical protein n=1 Tax=Enterococcus sp. RIT-PI-f TaxID=1690244 RepID=UPI0006B8B695|nr:hypothetical protein [Enterococcus sp. RIT-PI-f]KPG69764.1 hypothetical protein AEQ18_10090 [Enterococcus sp. RIT-PI-f]